MIKRFHWDQAVHPARRSNVEHFARVGRRIDAENWYTRLLCASGRRGAGQGPEPRVARLLMAGAPRWSETFAPADWWLMLGGPLRQLQNELRAFDEHRAWVVDRFCPSRIRWCRRRAFPGRVTLIYVLVTIAIIVLNAVLPMHGMIGAMNLPLYAGVGICVAIRLTHRKVPQR